MPEADAVKVIDPLCIPAEVGLPRNHSAASEKASGAAIIGMYDRAEPVDVTIVVPRGAQVTMTLVNADPDTAHGLVVTSTGSSSSYMPMMTTPQAFSGAAVWFLGNPTPAGMHEGSMTFTASTSGTYQYICPVPGHAQKGMVGSFIVEG